MSGGLTAISKVRSADFSPLSCCGLKSALLTVFVMVIDRTWYQS